MKRNGMIGKRIMSDTPMPGEVLTEIVDNRRVLIENHKGIVAYDLHEICIRTCSGVIRVEGNCLELKCISADKVIIMGQIQRVCLTW